MHGPGSNEIFAGGMTWPALVYALWEPFLAWGIIAGLLLLFRNCVNATSSLWDWLGRRSYAVYAIHPPILVGISLFLRRWHASPFPKTAVLTTLGCAASWLAAELLLRIPGMQRIL
jgi:peptidoglycan/LPS O-acetylase OafA/YrhL